MSEPPKAAGGRRRRARERYRRERYRHAATARLGDVRVDARIGGGGGGTLRRHATAAAVRAVALEAPP